MGTTFTMRVGHDYAACNPGLLSKCLTAFRATPHIFAFMSEQGSLNHPGLVGGCFVRVIPRQPARARLLPLSQNPDPLPDPARLIGW